MYQKTCYGCGIRYKQGGKNFCSRTCQRRYNQKKYIAWLKTHTAYEYLYGSASSQSSGISLNYNNQVASTIRREYRNTPKLRDYLLNENAKEVKAREQELSGYRLSDKKLF